MIFPARTIRFILPLVAICLVTALIASPAMAARVFGAAPTWISTQSQSLRQGQADNKRNDRQPQPQVPARPPEEKKATDGIRYSYEFNQPQFYVSRILIEHDSNGQGKITFDRQREGGTIEEPIVLSTAALGRVLGLWNSLQFLTSNENYQSEKQFPHLGTMRLQMDNGTNKRAAEFNWTENKTAAALVNEYRRVSDQAIFVFDMSVARENQPLNAPKLMELLESLLDRGSLSDPKQLVPLLRDISVDEHLPLIARNHAARLLKRIQ